MKTTIIILCSLLVAENSTIGQTLNDTNIKALVTKIKTADSVELISHVGTADFGGHIIPDIDPRDTLQMRRWNEQHPPRPKFLYKKGLNRKIVVESRILSAPEQNTLGNILMPSVDLKDVSYASCNFPAHSIIIYKSGKQSYVDFCFGCKRVNPSQDIDFSEQDMNNEKWDQLKDFFMALGLTKFFDKYNE